MDDRNKAIIDAAVERARGVFDGPPRDPARIDRVLAALGNYWRVHPDLRLGQIVGNCAGGEHVDPYYLEDDKVEAYLREQLSK